MEERSIMKETQMPKHVSRRGFLRSVAPGVGFGSVGWACSPTSAQSSAETNQVETTTGEPGEPIPTFDAICQQHLELVLRRSQRRHAQLEQSLRRSDARPVTVAAYQMRNHCGGEAGKDANLTRMLDAVGKLAQDGVRILAFPEMCLPGYFTSVSGTVPEAVAANHALADVVGKSPHLDQLRRAARVARMVLAFGFCEKAEGEYYNSIGVIDADGSWLGTRRKNPLSPQPYDVESFREPDASERSAVFQTAYGTVGVSNCYDGEFPGSIRRMRLDGAEILLWCNAATGNVEFGTSNRINYSGAYAQANRMWVVCCNSVDKNAYGTSLIVGPSGEPLVVLPTNQEAFGLATINLAFGTNWERWRLRLGPQWAEQVPDRGG
jgi:predicted amidohydrolase